MFYPLQLANRRAISSDLAVSQIRSPRLDVPQEHPQCGVPCCCELRSCGDFLYARSSLDLRSPAWIGWQLTIIYFPVTHAGVMVVISWAFEPYLKVYPYSRLYTSPE